MSWIVEDASGERGRSARGLVAVLPEVRAPKFATEAAPNYFDDGSFASELINFFASTSWQGILPSNGNSRKLPLSSLYARTIGCEQSGRACAGVRVCGLTVPRRSCA